MPDDSERPRLFLVTPAEVNAETFPPLLADVLNAANIAAVLIHANEAVAGALVPIIQSAGAAAITLDDTRVAGRVKADGVHIGTGLGDLRIAVDSFGGKRVVGAGNIHSRHAAMEAGEIGVDYVFFGRPHGDTHPEAHGKALDLAEWWSDLMEIPAVVMAGNAVERIAEATATGAAFVAVHDAVWSHPAGAVEAARRAAAMLASPGRRAA